MTNIQIINPFGRCVIAERDIKEGELIADCEILVLNPADTIKVNLTELRDYTFTYNDNQDCLVLGIGELFNHADKPNTCYSLVWLNGRHRMHFRALANIKQGEQLFINYADDLRDGEDKQAYTANLY